MLIKCVPINDRVRGVARESLSRHPIPVELRLEHTVTAVYPNRVECDYQERTETIPTATVLWTAGITTHPLIRSLPLTDKQRDRLGRPLVTPTLQLLDFPEVFAGGDCAAEEQQALPPLAQVAYQEGDAIAHNLKALSAGETPTPATVKLRGSLLKLGLGESVVNLFEKFAVSGQTGHLIRQATYLQLLPTPVHNFKATTEWLVDEIFQRHTSDRLASLSEQ